MVSELRAHDDSQHHGHWMIEILTTQWIMLAIVPMQTLDKQTVHWVM
jgi:hypothetical protein